MAESLEEIKNKQKQAWQRFDQRIGFLRRLQKRVIMAWQHKTDEKKIKDIQEKLKQF